MISGSAAAVHRFVFRHLTNLPVSWPQSLNSQSMFHKLLGFAHGANDMANAAGPLAAIVQASLSGEFTNSIGIPFCTLRRRSVVQATFRKLWRRPARLDQGGAANTAGIKHGSTPGGRIPRTQQRPDAPGTIEARTPCLGRSRGLNTLIRFDGRAPHRGFSLWRAEGTSLKLFAILSGQKRGA